MDEIFHMDGIQHINAIIYVDEIEQYGKFCIWMKMNIPMMKITHG
jgi:hypothetical protein